MAATSPYDELMPERIKANMLSDLEVKGAHIDSREGSYANTLVSVAAYQIYKLYQQFPSLLSMVFPEVRSIVEQIKPAHLRFVISGLTWADVESVELTWQWFEDNPTTWAEFDAKFCVHAKN